MSYLLSNEDSAKHKNKCQNQEEYNKEKGTTSISLTHMAKYLFLNVMLSFEHKANNNICLHATPPGLNFEWLP